MGIFDKKDKDNEMRKGIGDILGKNAAKNVTPRVSRGTTAGEKPVAPVKYDAIVSQNVSVSSSDTGSEIAKTEQTAEAAPVSVEESQDNQGPKKRMGEMLIDAGAITPDQLNIALKEKSRSGKMLGEVLVSLGFIDNNFLTTFISQASGVDRFEPSKVIVDPDLIEKVPRDVADKHKLLPISLNDEGVLTVAMLDPNDVVGQDKVRQFFTKGVVIKPLMATPKALEQGIDNAYGLAMSTAAILKELESTETDLQVIQEDEAYSHPIVRLVNALVFDAVKMGASDIHFEPEEQFIRLRYRIDGVLIEIQTFHKDYWNAMAQRIKIMAELNIADKMNPQDGRFYLNIGGREADFRVSSLPTVHGENFVLRILDKSAGIMPLEKLGFSERNMKLIRKAQAKPEGIIIVTGPTGSGKSTSLYSMLNEMNTIDVNIMTLEDPVEYSMPLMRQAQVRAGSGLTFADGVKSLLRQDPDIIFVGEVRDGPTAEQALKAAMTGHQVYTSLHTNDSFGAIPRLLDLGLKPGMLAGSVIAVFAQRLVRRLCGDCKEAYQPDERDCKMLDVDPSNPPTIYRHKGCPKCKNMGYKGRVAVAEILYFDDELNDIVSRDGHKSELRAAALKKGFKSMTDDGILKILEGLTDIEAVKDTVDLSDRYDD